jgi:hypothetical protein
MRIKRPPENQEQRQRRPAEAGRYKYKGKRKFKGNVNDARLKAAATNSTAAARGVIL